AANALSYSGLLLLKAFRFRAMPGWDQWLLPHASRVLRNSEGFLDGLPEGDFSDKEVGELNRSIIRNVRKYRALLTLMLMPAETAEERDRLTRYLTDALEFLSATTVGLTWQQRLAAYI